MGKMVTKTKRKKTREKPFGESRMRGFEEERTKWGFWVGLFDIVDDGRV